MILSQKTRYINASGGLLSSQATRTSSYYLMLSAERFLQPEQPSKTVAEVLWSITLVRSLLVHHTSRILRACLENSASLGRMHPSRLSALTTDRCRWWDKRADAAPKTSVGLHDATSVANVAPCADALSMRSAFPLYRHRKTLYVANLQSPIRSLTDRPPPSLDLSRL